MAQYRLLGGKHQEGGTRYWAPSDRTSSDVLSRIEPTGPSSFTIRNEPGQPSFPMLSWDATTNRPVVVVTSNLDLFASRPPAALP